MSNSIRNFLIAIAPFALLAISVEVYAQADDVDCIKCVDASDIAGQAVNSSKIAKQAVTAGKIAKQAVTSSKIAPGAVTSGKIKNGAVTTSKISPELASSINANSTSVIDLESDSAVRELRIHTLEHDIDRVLEILTACGDFKLYGCTQSTSNNGTVFPRNRFAGGLLDIIFYSDPSVATPGDGIFFAIPVAVNPLAPEQADYENLLVGGSANLTRVLPGHSNNTAVLVDDCDNPMVHLVRSGEPPTGRLVTNNGNFYRSAIDLGIDPPFFYGPIINTVDVTGQMYGLINPQTPGNIVETCTWVTDQIGLYDVYAIGLKFNVFDGRFENTWTHQ